MCFSQEISSGINLTGKERVWEKQNFLSSEIIEDIKILIDNDYESVRLPVAFNHYLENEKCFLSELRKIIDYTESNGITLVLAYFGHDLDDKNAKKKTKEISKNWLKVLSAIGSGTNHVYLEIVNEPNISPQVWESIAPKIISKVRKVDFDIPIILGATNYNSLFELSRTRPFVYNKLIYTFHYYEPYIFTHQGTEWTGAQNSTIGIPYPYQENEMPKLSKKARGTEGEINLRDYQYTGNKIAINDKISQIAEWAKINQVELWCTEFGVTDNAEEESRIAYLKEVKEVLNTYNIKGFVWEWDGNFGVRGLLF
ncbi:glycoside hydrolase family 5 protein [Belliella sp. R4-6]|uniref:Glycoside hydrolase family 5 protein n=1 Tax=Belliella alkalica TaxID=1730871 RepID=A0ABS9V7W1_9BACT|nr:cellulase family glycosylhydrolase [Belliella alkalica]MCH7412502.1 glycoside hydrolase family 5 protein [Belliella alkalica]